MCAIKIQEKSGPMLISDKSITTIRSKLPKLNSLDLQDKIKEIKSILPEFSKIYRTYNINKLNIKRTFSLL
jgi:hypothetical protein